MRRLPPGSWSAPSTARSKGFTENAGPSPRPTMSERAATGRAGNLAPLAIGMTLTLNIIMGGALTGAAFKPARALGPMIVTGNLNDAWLYVAAPIVGAIVAAMVHLGLTRLARQPTAAEPG